MGQSLKLLITGLMVVAGLWTAALPASAETDLAVYSMRELIQAPPFPKGTKIRLHAAGMQDIHGILLLDEHCEWMCDDSFFLYLPKKTWAGFKPFGEKVQEGLDFRDKQRAYFDMIVIPIYFSETDKATNATVQRVAVVDLVEVISAELDTRDHWLATHP